MLYWDDSLLLSVFLTLNIASFCVLTQVHETRFAFSHAWALSIVVLGVVFNVASLFFPWGILTSSSAYVYLSGSIANDWSVLLPEDFFIIMQARDQLITISNLINAAVIAGCAGVVLDVLAERHVISLVRRRVISYSVLLASSVLSFIAVVMFALTEINLSWGAYLALAGGAIIVFGIVMKELKVEVVVEREVSEQEE